MLWTDVRPRFLGGKDNFLKFLKQHFFSELFIAKSFRLSPVLLFIRMTDPRKLKPIRKWTELMNADILSCKREAVPMTLLEQPPRDGNGRKKGCIRIMSELWDAKGSGDLGLSSQNLRDQAARLEKTLEESSENLLWEAQTDANSKVLAQRNVSMDA